MAKVNSGKISLIAIIMICVVPLALAFFMYFGQWGVPTGRINNGTLLLPPQQLDHLDIIKQPDVVGQGLHWVIILVPESNCGSTCQDKLHTLRQLHLALGKEAHRVMRLLMVKGSDVKSLSLNYPNMQMAIARNSSMFTEGAGVYLVDPFGNIMMFYGFDQVGKPIFQDLKRLLKNSNIG